ncbi:hypothetical protein Tco_0171507, partial [Tanacetum coccineum]
YQKLDGIHFPCSCWDEKWLVQEGTAHELASPEQTAIGKDMLNPLYGCDGLPKTVRVFQFTLDSRSEKGLSNLLVLLQKLEAAVLSTTME